MQTSPLFSLNLKDLVKGLIVAIISAVLIAMQTKFQAGSITINWKATGAVALATGLSYLIKNFFTPAQSSLQQANTTQTTA